MSELWNDFKKFIMRGNVLDLAVAVIIGLAFNAVVQSFVDDVLMRLIGAVFGKPTFDDLTWEIGDGVVRYGAFITQVINFLIIAFAVFLIVKVFERLQSMRKGGAEEVDERSDEVILLSEIRDLLRTRS
jgi:large conductance mechanosensitive channel